jgi:hypothetical protein
MIANMYLLLWEEGGLYNVHVRFNDGSNSGDVAVASLNGFPVARKPASLNELFSQKCPPVGDEICTAAWLERNSSAGMAC